MLFSPNLPADMRACPPAQGSVLQSAKVLLRYLNNNPDQVTGGAGARVAVTDDPLNFRVFENRRVESHRFLGLVIEPQKRGDLLNRHGVLLHSGRFVGSDSHSTPISRTRPIRFDIDRKNFAAELDKLALAQYMSGHPAAAPASEANAIKALKPGPQAERKLFNERSQH